jgi:dipeptidyl-peptidase-4
MKRILFSAALVAGSFLQAQNSITLEDIYKNNTFKTEFAGGGQSMKDGEHYTEFGQTADGKGMALMSYEYKTGKFTAELFRLTDLVPEGKTEAVDMDDYSLSPDETKVLISTEQEHIYRYSTKENYYILDLKTKKMFPLSAGGKQRLATFSPDASKVAFMRDNNIFIVDLATRKETQITTDGEWNKIINGCPD